MHQKLVNFQKPSNYTLAVWGPRSNWTKWSILFFWQEWQAKFLKLYFPFWEIIELECVERSRKRCRLWRATYTRFLVRIYRPGQTILPFLRFLIGEGMYILELGFMRSIRYWLVHRLTTTIYCVGQVCIHVVSKTSRRNRFRGASHKGLTNTDVCQFINREDAVTISNKRSVKDSI